MFSKRNRVVWVVVLAALWVVVAVGRTLAIDTGTTKLVSHATDGTAGDSSSEIGGMSDDGRFIVFHSSATNLIASDANGHADDVFIYDRQTDEVSLVSKASDGTQGDAGSFSAQISPNGRYVGFGSSATNLGPPGSYYFIHDLQTGETTPWTPRHSNGTPGNHPFPINSPVWSADARYIVFDSASTNLVDDDANGDLYDVFVYDTQTSETTMVSRHSDGTAGNASSYDPDISADGRYVTFTSDASNLIDESLPTLQQVFIHDRQTGETTLVSRNNSGAPADWESYDPSISGDGRYVAFASRAENLDPNDTNGLDIYIRDRLTGQTIPVSQNSLSSGLDFGSYEPQISTDGRYVTFTSPDLMVEDENNRDDVFLFDRLLNSWKIVSRHSDGTQGNWDSGASFISADGQIIAFWSEATNLVDTLVPGWSNVYVHELATLAPPTAAFTASPLSGAAPLAVSFTDQSTGGPIAWSWTFGDGGTSTQRHPNHTYISPGTYNVSLTASNADGSDVETKTAYVTVTPPPPSASLYVSPAKAGTVGGISVAPQDILYRDGVANTWAMHFDGSDVGLSKAITAFAHLPGGDLLLVFKANQPTPAGTFTAWDVARFTPSSLGNTTAGTFSWYLDGSDVGLSAGGEKIDALDVLPDGRVLISTTGALSVPVGGGALKSQDEDLTAFTPAQLGETTTGAWALYFNGTAVPGLKSEDVAGVHVDAATGDIYVTIVGGFNVGGVSGNDKDVLKLHPTGGGAYTPSLHWRGPGNGFNLKIGGVEMG